MRLHRPILFFAAAVAPVAALFFLNARAWQTGVSHEAASYLPFLLDDVVSMQITPRLPYFIADLDQDGDDELLINEPDRLLRYRIHGNRMILAGEGVYERPGSTRMVADADGDGRPEFFVIMDTPDGSMLSCHDWFSPDGTSEILYTIGPLIAPLDSGLSSRHRIVPFGSFTYEQAAHPEIFIGINSMRTDDAPRWLLAFDGVTGRELWRFCLGPKIADLICGDFGGSISRVVFTTNAVNNGVSCNGTSDSLSYVFCLDARDGSLLWREQVAGRAGLGHLAIADVNEDSHDEILVARYAAWNDPTIPDNPKPWTIQALSDKGEVISALTLSSYADDIIRANLDDDPFPELLVDGMNGTLFILNHDLSVERAVGPLASSDAAGSYILGVRDLNGDGKPEIVSWLGNGMAVRDRRGKIIARREYGLSRPDVQFIRFGGKNYIAAAIKNTIRVMTLKQVPLAKRLRAHSRRLALGAAAAVLVSFWGAFHIRRVLKHRRERHITEYEVQNELLTAMSAFGHGGSSLKVLDRLRLHLKNWERIRSEGVTREQLFSRLSQTFGETIVPELEHLVMLSRRARVPEGIWNALLAEAARAAGEMEGILASGAEGNGRQNMHVGKALAALDTLDESVAGIRSHLRSVFRAPVQEALERLIERFRDEYGEKDVTFDLAQQDPAAAACVFISPISFDKIFEVLLSNAVRATAGKAPAEISIAVQWEGNYCRIDVRDNGCGIPRDDWERIFERHFTTKAEGGGFGLHYAREELAKFGGKIYVLDSAAGSGTTLRVILRKSEKAGAV